MRILGACIFFKVFWRENYAILTGCYLQSFKNLEYACFKHPGKRLFKLLTANLRNFVNIYLFRLRYNPSKRKAFWKSEDTIFAWNLTSVGIVVKI